MTKNDDAAADDDDDDIIVYACSAPFLLRCKRTTALCTTPPCCPPCCWPLTRVQQRAAARRPDCAGPLISVVREKGRKEETSLNGEDIREDTTTF